MGLLLIAFAAGSQDGGRAAGLALGAALGVFAVRRFVERTVGPVGAYALVVGLRGAAMLGGGAILVAGRFVEDRKRFWIWLLAAYLAALVSETVTAARASGRKG